MKNYYDVLGLSITASEQQVKTAFRRLAVMYHPDKNPQPEAEAMFKEINEAYEVLGDPVKKHYYDQLLAGIISVVTAAPAEESAPWHRDPAYRRRRQAGYKPPPREPSATTVMMESLLKYVRILSWVGCVWSLLLITDYLLPNRVIVETVASDLNAVKRASVRKHGDQLVTEKGHHFHVSMNELKFFPVYSDLHIYSSRLFSILIRVENEEHSYQLNNLASIYRNFIFMPAILFVLSVVGLSWNKGIESRFSLGTVLFIIFLMNIGFFYTSIV